MLLLLRYAMKTVFLKEHHSMLLLLSTLFLRTAVDAQQVIGGALTVVQGDTAVLRCNLINTTETLTQISWQRRTREKTQNENFFTISKGGPQFVNGHDHRFKFIGSFKDNNGSLQLANVTLVDEGTYTCIITLFPSGNHKREIPLNVLVPPVTSLDENHPTLGNEEVSLVNCTAAASKPPAEVRWLTGTLAEKVRAETKSTLHANGTTTTVSSLFGVPTREINHLVVHCVVTGASLSTEETLPFTIQVHFSPMEVNITESSKDSFQCVTEANPNATFTWSRSDKSWPQSAVRVEGAMLHFLTVTSDLNGLYQCEASNPYGSKRSHLYVHFTSACCYVCWTLFGLSLSAVAVAATVWYLHKSGNFPSKWYIRTEDGIGEETETVQATRCFSGMAQRGEGDEEEERQAEGRL